VRSFFKKFDRADTYGALPRRGSNGRSHPVHITALAERTSGLDENLGSLIGDMRLALGMTPGELALRLGTTVDVIMTLEQGRLRALPHWEETQRIVLGLSALHRVDARPILQRIFEQTSQTHIGAPPERGAGALMRGMDSRPNRLTERLADRMSGRAPARITPSEPPPPRAPNSARPAKRWAKPRRARRRGRALMAVAGPMVMIAAAVWTVQAQPRALRDAIAGLPATISHPVLGGLDALAVRLAPRRDGLRWIDVSDPRSRKADRLNVDKR
jgi:hypothetical protein